MKNNEPLILLHGALGSRDQFAEIEELVEDTFQVYSLNFEGHGGRKSEREYSMDHFKENLLDFMKEKSLTEANIFGFSMGGYVALKLAKDYPDKVKRLMTLGTKFHWTSEVANTEVSRLNPLKIEEKLPRYAEELKLRHAPVDWHQVLSKTSEMMLAMGKGASLEVEDFQDISCEVLIGLGSEDKMVTLEESQKIAEAIPGAKLEVFQGFKHPLQQVDQQALSSKIKDFFST